MIEPLIRTESRRMSPVKKLALSVVGLGFLCSLLLYNTQPPITVSWGPFSTIPLEAKRRIEDTFRRRDITRNLQDYGGTEESRPTPPTCKPKNHIMFLKIHKCASSSIQNMLMRYGLLHNLTFALPTERNYLGSPDHFQANMLHRSLLPQSGVVDIFAVHTRLNPVEHRKVLHPDTVFITVVRDPPQLFESLFNYFRLSHFYGAPFETFLNWPYEKQQSFNRPYGRFGPNMILFDMGLKIHPNLTAVEVRQAVDMAEELFDLVMIAEKLDESLILLKELLCWNYTDIIFFPKNARRDELKRNLTVSSLEKLRRLNSGDVLLYNHFLSKHKEAVVRYGEKKMADEVAFLQNLRQEFFEDCGTRVVKKFAKNSMFKEYSNQVSGYVLENNSNTNCVLLSLPELQLVSKVRKHQIQILNETRILRIQEKTRLQRKFISAIQNHVVDDGVGTGSHNNETKRIQTNTRDSNDSYREYIEDEIFRT